MLPKISVITISYNSVGTIEETIKSVVNQGYENLEYIIVDGGSTDGTIEIIKKYEPFIHRWVSEKDQGISDAFNKGIRLSTGDIIGIVNSDDQYLPGALWKIAESYSQEIDVYRGSILIVDSKASESYTYEPSMKFGMLPIYINVCHLPTFIAKRAYEIYGDYDRDFKLAMDLDLLRRFYRKGAKFKRINAVLGQFNVGGLSTKAGIENAYKEREKVILKNGGNHFWVLIYRWCLAAIDCFKWIIKKMPRINYKAIRYGNRL